MTATVITMCSNRKRGDPAADLSAAGLARGTADAVAAVWGRRLVQAPCALTARQLYGGRGFREAEAAAEAQGGAFLVVSAGLGLVAADAAVPAYGLTLLASHADGILGKIDDDEASAWWRALTSVSPFHSPDIPGRGLILAALSAPYMAMVADDWAGWPAERFARLRVFSKSPPVGAAAALAPAWMPYDDRLDAIGPGHAGTQADFAQRALRHFAVTFTTSSRGAPSDAAAVRAGLQGLTERERPERKRLDDADLLALISAEWDAAGGRSGAMLRRLRDDLHIACEQSRLKTLFKTVAASRGSAS
ncbi:hypothetical protein [Phenylobacterium sp.]|uniref:hypothetical protein n=1 Tax=Phenylobacterium sp. TaxID=1871053 RepID=UPI003563ED12